MGREIVGLTPEQTYPLRHQVLRQGRPLQSCRWEGDFLSTTHHFGIVDGDGPPVGILSYFSRPSPYSKAEVAWQLRGMAVDPQRQGEGLGAELLLESMVQIRAESPASKLVWCNARLVAVEFYRRRGFVGRGEAFEIEGVGPHLVMEHRPQRG